MDDGCPTFYGKYRGTVENHRRPDGQGRIQVSVPDVLGDGKLAWAMPCMPYAGHGRRPLRDPPHGRGRLGRVRARRSGLSDLAGLLLGPGRGAEPTPGPQRRQDAC